MYRHAHMYSYVLYYLVNACGNKGHFFESALFGSIGSPDDIPPSTLCSWRFQYDGKTVSILNISSQNNILLL